VLQAQGKGCGPGVLGVCIGGDSRDGYELSRRSFSACSTTGSRTEAGRAGAGYFENGERTRHRPDGFLAAKTTLLGVKICVANRVAGVVFRQRELHVLGVPPSGRDAGCGREDWEMALLRQGPIQFNCTR